MAGIEPVAQLEGAIGVWFIFGLVVEMIDWNGNGVGRVQLRGVDISCVMLGVRASPELEIWSVPIVPKR